MSKIININAVFDTDALVNKYKPGGSPNGGEKGILHKDIYMVTGEDDLYHPNTQASADLWIKAEQDDEVRWRSVSMSANVTQSVIIYKIEKYEGDLLMKTPEPNLAMPWRPVPEQDADLTVHPLKFKAMQIPDYYLSSNIARSGTEGYKVFFYIARQTTGNHIEPVGYYYWDPRITVN
ncbi:AidA/PixA family protein [Chromobacterium sp. CV08]|uniref:AidA/PixA family protein n=1 Tax=Chromobacterium sp. CV08 TaxID=3133274 RepID=UPI003DA89087